MARYNEILVGRYNRFAQKLLGMKGGPPAPQLASDIGLNINLFHGSESHLHQGWTRWARTFSIVGTTGASMQLRNPGGSNTIVVVHKIVITNQGGAADTFFVNEQAQTVDLPTISTSGFPLDTRQTSNGSGIISASTTTVPGGNQLFAAILGPNLSQEVIFLAPEQEIIITPGFAVSVQGLIGTSSMRVNFWWRERALEEGELVQ
jgi:hypothetical protein